FGACPAGEGPDQCPNNALELCEGPHAGVCFATAECACANGATACHRCILDYGPEGAALRPCEPAVGPIDVGCTLDAPCSIDVFDGPDWRADLTSDPGGLGQFVTPLDGIHGHFGLRVKRTSNVDIVAPGVVGSVVIVATQPGGVTRAIEVMLMLTEPEACTSLGSGNFTMACT